MLIILRDWRVLIERCEQLVFVALNALLLLKFWPGMFQAGHVIATLYVLNQTLIVFLLIFRRPAQNLSLRPGDHLIAAASTLLPLLVQPPSGNNVIPFLPLLSILVVGLVLHIGAKFSLRRSFGILPANRGIKSEGLYRIVRHPMYLGYVLVDLSLVLSGPTAWNIAILLASWLLFALRISAEERLLGQSPDYREFCRATRYRLLPGVY